MKKNFIFFLLFLAFFITVLKLYYVPAMRILWKGRHSLSAGEDDDEISEPTRALCPVSGYKCPDERNCNCAKICGSDYRMHKVGSGERIVMTNVQLEKGGIYCLPKWQLCNLKTSRHVYTTNGWSCIPRDPQIWTSGGKRVACTSPNALNNDANYLYDRKLQKRVDDDEDVHDYYETYAGALRYVCACESLDNMNNRMISLDAFPFACFSDYCKSNVYDAGIPGWTGHECDCGHLQHVDPGDPKSPCVNTPTRIRASKMTVNVQCVDGYRVGGGRDAANLFYCPDTYNSKVPNDLFFEKIVTVNERDEVQVLKTTRNLYEQLVT